jgi:hypothetical protein
MKKKLFLLLVLLIALSSCSNDTEEEIIEVDLAPELTQYQLDVIEYFKDIALGFEFGNASRITRKWEVDMKIYVEGTLNDILRLELDRIIVELNELVTDGFQIRLVDEVSESNYFLFLGTGDEYAQLYPDTADLVNANWGLFTVFWDEDDQLNSGRMYVDIERADTATQRHLLREELTQSLGLARDLGRYSESIFYSAPSTTIEFAEIDRDLIRLLYHPEMISGLGQTEVDGLLRHILLNE